MSLWYRYWKGPWTWMLKDVGKVSGACSRIPYPAKHHTTNNCGFWPATSSTMGHHCRTGGHEPLIFEPAPSATEDKAQGGSNLRSRNFIAFSGCSAIPATMLRRKTETNQVRLRREVCRGAFVGNREIIFHSSSSFSCFARAGWLANYTLGHFD